MDAAKPGQGDGKIEQHGAAIIIGAVWAVRSVARLDGYVVMKKEFEDEHARRKRKKAIDRQD